VTRRLGWTEEDKLAGSADAEAMIAGMLDEPLSALRRLVFADYLEEAGRLPEARAWRFMAEHGIVGRWLKGYRRLFVRQPDDGLFGRHPDPHSASGWRYRLVRESPTGYWGPKETEATPTSVVNREWAACYLTRAHTTTTWKEPDLPPPGSPGDMWHPVRAMQMLAAAFADATDAVREEWHRKTLTASLLAHADWRQHRSTPLLADIWFDLNGIRYVSGRVEVGRTDPSRLSVTTSDGDVTLLPPASVVQFKCLDAG
jgi:hypothetical protein